MEVTRRDLFNGNEVTLDIPALNDPDVYDRYTTWNEGFGIIQVMLPELTADEREFLITGLTPERWKEITGGN